MQTPIEILAFPDIADDTAVRAGLARPLTVEVAGRTDKGRRRSNNEDSLLVTTVGRMSAGRLFAVADGMGGHAGGEYASAAAVAALNDLAAATEDAAEFVNRLRPAVEELDVNLISCGRRKFQLAGMGTTLTAAVLIGRKLHLAHVGDSRAYLYRTGHLQRLTADHTLLEEMVDRGMLTPAEAAEHPLRHVVTNALGGSTPGVRVDQPRLDVRPFDVLLLCSDGLTEMLGEDEIAGVLEDADDPTAAAEELIRRANDKGGRDNVTVVVARLT